MITKTAQEVLERRYFLEDESTWQELVARVANSFSSNEEEYENFYWVLNNGDFLLNSPALMNAGTDIKSYSACFVLPIQDNMESIFKYYGDAALISKSGGGVGANFSKLREKGAMIGKGLGKSSGPISFMKVQDEATEAVAQGGRRKGANMMILDCDHPDIWEFISAKDTEGVLTNANLSVMVTDEFMDLALMGDIGGDKAYELWSELCKRAWSSAEPGVLFKDTIERGNLVPHLGKLEQTNPCGEQPLLPYESCTLGSINLGNMVRDGKIDWVKLKQTVHTAVLMLNRVLDNTTMPIFECQVAMEQTRKIGLGIMGLHDMLIQLGLPYDSEIGRDAVEQVMACISEEADMMSMRLGEQEGFYKACDPYGNAGPVRRNANLLTVAPTGTLSMIADCSSGCEPYYAPVTYKTVMDGTTFEMPNKWVKMKMEEEGVSSYEDLSTTSKSLLKGAGDIHWRDHILMQAVIQMYVDSSISKTINMPNNATVQEVQEAYEFAYKEGCKGVTIYRDGSRDTQVLSTSSDESVSRDTKENTKEDTGKLKLPDVLEAKRYRVRDKDKNKVYIIIGHSNGKPMEVFAKMPYKTSDIHWGSTCRMVSLSLRYAVPLVDIVKQLEKSSRDMFDIPAQLSKILKSYMVENMNWKPTCPDCGQEGIIFESGCERCGNCGWSKCS